MIVPPEGRELSELTVILRRNMRIRQIPSDHVEF